MDAKRSGPTHFEDVTWEISTAELSRRYPQLKRAAGGDGVLTMTGRQRVAGLPANVSFRFRDGRLEEIWFGLLNRYDDWVDGKLDERIVVAWLEHRAGMCTSRGPASVVWELPTMTIRTLCDDSLGVRFVPRA